MKTLAAVLAYLVTISVAVAADHPNIVYILCDDLGYGDIHCMAPETSRIPTPHADQLAAEGMRFTDAHSGSAVCTPTRYGILTGRYSWRTQLQQGVVQGFAPSLIAADRPTVAGFLRQHGYHTTAIGKWHLNCEYLDPDSKQPLTRRHHRELPPIGSILPDGPIHRGFDEYLGFHHSGHMQAVIENDRVIAHDDEIHMLPRLEQRAVDYIESRADSDQPFFLYLPLSSPHTPVVPAADWQGKSGLGPYADFVMQTDHVAGAVLDALKRHQLADRTLVIFTSDNGTSKAHSVDDLLKKGHLPTAHLRGSKADLWDGGHRIPFIVRWPGNVPPGSVSDQLICLTDLFATVAEIVGVDIPAGSCEDSVSFLPALFEKEIESTRAGVVHHSISGHFAYRQGPWKLVLARGSGGWTFPTEDEVDEDAPAAQLYHLDDDPSETTNLFPKERSIADRLLRQLNADVTNGRSTSGADSENDHATIVLWKTGRP